MAYLIAGHGGETPYNIPKPKDAQNAEVENAEVQNEEVENAEAQNPEAQNPEAQKKKKKNKSKKKSFKVPPGCTIVVHKHPYELSYEYHAMTKKLLSLPKEVINNPVQHKYEIINKLGSVVFYEAGEQCPYFEYQTLSCFPSEQPYTKCYGMLGSGVNNLMAMKDQYDRTNISEIRKMRYKDTLINYDNLDLTSDTLKEFSFDEIIELLSYMYRYSVYPTQAQVVTYIRENLSHFYTTIHRNMSTNRLKDLKREMIKEILRGITNQTFVNPSQEFLCKKFPGVYYNFVCRYTQGTYNIDRLNYSLLKSQTKHNTLLYSKPKLLRAPAFNINTNTNTTPVPGWIIQSNEDSNEDPSIRNRLQIINERQNNITKRKNRTVNLLKTRILEAELKRKKNIKNFYMNPKYVSNRKEALSKLYNDFAEVDDDYRSSGNKMPDGSVNRYIERFKNYEFLTTFKPPSNETNSEYNQLQNGTKRWVKREKQGGTRKRK
jgi:hypothetical protein